MNQGGTRVVRCEVNFAGRNGYSEPSARTTST